MRFPFLDREQFLLRVQYFHESNFCCQLRYMRRSLEVKLKSFQRPIPNLILGFEVDWFDATHDIAGYYISASGFIEPYLQEISMPRHVSSFVLPTLSHILTSFLSSAVSSQFSTVIVSPYIWSISEAGRTKLNCKYQLL